MVSESLSKKFRPAGFEQPEGSRHGYTKPRPELQEAFYQWVNEIPKSLPNWNDSENQYQKALKSLEEFGEIKAEEANSLLVDFKPKTKAQKEAGLFVSACYTHSLENIIVFDADIPDIDCIGYKTNKSIFNNGKVGNGFAWDSSGLAVNNGDCGNGLTQYSSGLSVNNGECSNLFAFESSGLAVNNGDCGDGFAHWSSGLIVAVKEPKNYGYKKNGLTIKPADCERIPELKSYLLELGDLTKAIKDEESARKFLQRYGPEPKERIEREIKEFLKKRK